MLYGIFESVNMGSTRYAERIFDCVSTKDVENGMFGYLGELADGYDHIFFLNEIFVFQLNDVTFDASQTRRTKLISNFNQFFLHNFRNFCFRSQNLQEISNLIG